MFRLQQEQQSKWQDIPSLTEKERDEYLESLSLMMIHEVMDFMDARKYKKHKVHTSPLPRETQILELIDIQKFLMIAALHLDVTPQEWFDAFVSKTMMVEDQWRQDNVVFEEGRVICCDIDDVLTHYENARRREDEPHFYRTLTPKLDNIHTLNYLRKCGFQVVLITSRKAHKSKVIVADTIQWLNRFDVAYDAILWGHDKAENIKARLGNVKPVFAIENSRKHAIDIADSGVPTYWINHGNGLPDHPNITSIRSLEELPVLRERGAHAGARP